MKKLILTTGLFIQITHTFAQDAKFESSQLADHLSESFIIENSGLFYSDSLNFAISDIEEIFSGTNEKRFSINSYNIHFNDALRGSNTSARISHKYNLNDNPRNGSLRNFHLANSYSSHINFEIPPTEKEPFYKNRRNVYSGLWAFASLNYIYADLVGLMDKNKLIQYQTGVVEGVKITPQFLTVAAAFMQIPLSNVFLPQVIKNDKTLRWVQIASGSIMTLVQAGTLFVGKPAPYYTLFSVFEIAATTYITIDAIKWKPKNKGINPSIRN